MCNTTKIIYKENIQKLELVCINVICVSKYINDICKLHCAPPDKTFILLNWFNKLNEV